MANGATRSVFIIDDDDDVTPLLEALVMAEEGYVVLGTAETPKFAGAVFAADAPDVVLVGEHRGGFDAMATVSYVRAALPDACIVLLADFADPITLLDALARGANTVLSSAAGWCELMPAVDLLLDGHLGLAGRAA